MDKSVIGCRLVALRGNRKQAEVATAIGVTPAAISQYESGKRIPNDDIKMRIASYYKTNVTKIFYS